MKKLFLIIVFLFACQSAHAVTIDLSAIAVIESATKQYPNGNPKAFNSTSGARGMYQITPVCLADYNDRTGQKIALTALYDMKTSERIATWYFSVRLPQIFKSKNIPITTENLLAGYNAGPGIVKKVLQGKRKYKTETVRYIEKYRAYIERNK